MSSGRSKVTTKLCNGLYVLDVQTPVKIETVNIIEEGTVSLKECHEALAHIGIEKVKKTLKSSGIPFINDFVECDARLRGKQHRQPSRSKPDFARAEQPGRMYADTCDVTEYSINGNKHFLCICDDYCQYRCVYCIPSKKQVPECI